MKPLQHFLFLCFFLLSLQSKATHIVGGEMNYTCLGNDQYEITLTIFRDCYNGAPGAYFDDPAYIGIFGSNNNLLNELSIPLMEDDTLDPVLSSECLVVPPNVCVHTTTYTTTVTLPNITGGYNLIYQRCCRNETIVNIENPNDAGATYSVFISEEALENCNSGPKFQTWPPIYICVNEPIIFDQSAVDIDGDSIVYSLCTPLLGATPDDPQPLPSDQTIPEPVTWQSPYSLDNMLGGVPLQIDPETGLLTGLPNTIGQFVVGICLEEYRNGELISTIRRDFQYNVGVCGETISSFFAPEVQCDGFTVEFGNESENANEYIWFFNDPENPDFFSEMDNPSYTYSDTGQYEIMLIAEPDNVCVDTSYQTVSLQYASLFADFEIEFGECSDSVVIFINNLSYDTISSIVEWSWTLIDGTQVVASSNLEDPVSFTYDISTLNFSTLILRLDITAANGCTQHYTEAFTSPSIMDELPADTLTICHGDSIALNEIFDSEYIYEWLPSNTLNDANIGNPIASPLETTTYTVTIVNPLFDCQTEKSITIIVPPVLDLLLPNDTTICSPQFELFVESNGGVEFYWAHDEEINDVFAFDTFATVTPLGENTYYVLVRDSIGCFAKDSVTLIGNGVNVDAIDIEFLCEGDTLDLLIEIVDPVDILTYNWTPLDEVVIGSTTPTPTVAPIEPGDHFFYVDMENQFGCELTDSILVEVIDTTSQLDFVSYLQCDSFSVNFENTSVNGEFFLWNFGDLVNPFAGSTETNPTYVYPFAGTYNVMLTIDADVPCKDTIIKQIVVGAPMIDIDFTFDYDECSDSVEISFTDLSTNTQSNFTDWFWEFSNGDTSTSQNPTTLVFDNENLLASLSVSSDDGCESTFEQIVPISIIEIELLDTIVSCVGTSDTLNPNFNPSYDYLWFPSEGLDDPNAPNPIANVSETTTYSVLITDFSIDTCQIERSITIVKPPEINLDVNDDMDICEDDFTIWANSPEAISYTWSLDANFDNVLSNDSAVLVQPAQPSIYYVMVIDEYSCMKTDEIVISNNAVDVAMTDVVSTCLGMELQLASLNLNANDILTYSWEPAENVIEGQSTNTPIVSVEETTTFVAQISNQYGCEYTDSIIVNVIEYEPPLFVEANPDTILQGESTQLNSTNDISYTYEWTPESSLNNSSIYNPTATPDDDITYELFIEDQNGCVNEASIRVIVLSVICEDPYIFVPTAFTPNGDGENDVFYVLGNAIDELHLMIYNRWGQKVFESRSKELGWDGTFKGKELAPDVFGYYLEIKCVDGNEFLKKGNITLLK